MKQFLLILLSLEMCGTFCNCEELGRVSGPQWSEEQKKSQRETAGQLLSKLQNEIAAGKKELVIPPGDYRFDRPAKDVLFAGVADTIIRAEGVVFWFDSRTGKRLLFKQCRNVTLRGLTIDTDPLPWFQGTITAVDKQAHTMDFVSEPGYTIPEGPALERGKRVLFFDGETSLELPVYDDGVARMENLGSGKIRIEKFWSNRAFLDPVIQREIRPGDRLALALEQATGGGIDLTECSDMHLEDITLYGAGGFAYHEAEGMGGNTYLRCKLVRRPDSNRLLAAPRDCFHSFLMERGPRIEKCEFSWAADDLVAIHGFFGIVLEKLSPKEFLFLSPFGKIVRESSTMKIIDPLSNTLRGQGKAVAVTSDETPEVLKGARSLPDKLKTEKGISIRSLGGARVFKVAMDREVEVGRYDLVSCGDFSGRGAVVKDNYLHDGHVRGVLAKTENLVVENNAIERTGHGGIVLVPEYYWLEGPVNSNIRITGNRLFHNGWSTFDRAGFTSSMAAIEVGSHFGKRLFPRTFVTGALNFDVEILNNKISDPAGPGILVMNTDGVKIEGNSIKSPFAAGIVPGFYDWSKLPVAPNPPDSDKRAGFKEPFYGTFIFDSSHAEIGSNPVIDPPSFLKGDVGVGPRVDRK